MGYSHHFYKDYSFILTKVSGKIDGNTLKQHVTDINNTTKEISKLKELVDCTKITNLKLLSTLSTIMSAENEIDKPGSKLAILTPKDRNVLYAMARVYKMFSEDHREEVKIFHAENDAITWLADSNIEATDLKDFVNNA